MSKPNSKKNRAFFLLIFFAASFLFFSCKKKSAVQIQDEISLNIFETEEKKSFSKSSHPSHKKICIVFGHGYEEKNYVEKIVAALEKKYGLDENGSPDSGIIFPLVFPDDFPLQRISRLPSLIGERELEGLIVIGAPEGTNNAIAALEDEWDTQEKMIPYPVYAFFPQDDVQGIEATCNFVVDLALEGSGSVENEETNKEEISQTQIKDLDALLDRAIEYMLLTEAPLPPDKNLIEHVARIVGKNYEVSRYIDAESGLQSINHFVIEEAKNSAQNSAQNSAGEK